MKPIIIASSTCAPCAALKTFIDEHDIVADIYLIGTLEGDTLASLHEVMTVPTILIGGEKFIGDSADIRKLLLENNRNI